MIASKTKLSDNNKAEYSFRRGYLQSKQKDAKHIRSLVMKELGIKTYPSWQARLWGRIEPKVSEAQAIESIFAEYGITDVWGLE